MHDQQGQTNRMQNIKANVAQAVIIALLLAVIGGIWQTYKDVQHLVEVAPEIVRNSESNQRQDRTLDNHEFRIEQLERIDGVSVPKRMLQPPRPR